MFSGANFSFLTILKRSQHSCFCLHTKNMAEIFISKSCKIHCPKAQLFGILMDAKIRKYEKKNAPLARLQKPWPKNVSVCFNLPPPFTASLCLCLCFHANVVDTERENMDDVVKLSLCSGEHQTNSLLQNLVFFSSPVYSLI